MLKLFIHIINKGHIGAKKINFVFFKLKKESDIITLDV